MMTQYWKQRQTIKQNPYESRWKEYHVLHFPSTNTLPFCQISSILKESVTLILPISVNWSERKEPSLPCSSSNKPSFWAQFLNGITSKSFDLFLSSDNCYTCTWHSMWSYENSQTVLSCKLMMNNDWCGKDLTIFDSGSHDIVSHLIFNWLIWLLCLHHFHGIFCSWSLLWWWSECILYCIHRSYNRRQIVLLGCMVPFAGNNSWFL